MKIDRYTSGAESLIGLIDNYYIIEADPYTEVQTIPNGRIDAVIVLQGEIEWFFPEENYFKPLPSLSFFPATSSPGLARTREYFKCISIKFFPQVLFLSAFRHNPLKGTCSFAEIFQTPERDKVLIHDLSDLEPGKMIGVLDEYFAEQLIRRDRGYESRADIIRSLDDETNERIRVGELAGELGICTKTFERRFNRMVGITPKMFSKIRQLQQTLRKILKNNSVHRHGDISDSLGNSYYDQAHFIKSCRKITGHSPKKLFQQLAPQMSDLLVVRQGNKKA